MGTFTGLDHAMSKRKRRGWTDPVMPLCLVLLFLSVATAHAQTGIFCGPTGSEAIRTDKYEYQPGEDVYITGTGFQPRCDVYVRVTRPDGKVMKGDGTTTPGMDIATTDDSGNFVSVYVRQGNSISGEHVVDVLDGEINVVSYSIFYNPEPPAPLACPFTVDPSIPADNLDASTFKTIQSAVTYLPNPGPCTIEVLPGTYDEFVNLVTKNTAAADESQRITLEAPYGPVIVAPKVLNSVGFTLTNSKYITITGFTVKGSSVHRGISLSGATGNSNWDISIDGNFLQEIGTPSAAGSAGIAVGSGNPRTWITNNLIRNNARGGIDISNGSGPTYIVNNTIHGNGWNGITRASGSGTNAVASMINNLVTGNGAAADVAWGRWGIYQSGTGNAAQATLRNNMFFYNGAYSGGALSSGGDISTAGLLDSTDWDNYTTNGRASSSSSPATGIAGCIFTDCYPSHLFTEIYSDTVDYVPLKTASLLSPAVDKGLNSFYDSGYEWVPAVDLYGGPRVLDGDGNGTAIADMGYCEAPGTDTAPPDTIIDSGPSGSVNTTSATFTFHATEPGSTFLCSLDGGAEAACNTRSASYGGLTEGSHTFSVRATDGSGNADPDPAIRTWTVDTTPPDTIIDTAPPSPGGDTAAFTFRATESGSTFECGIDGGPFTACTSPKSYSGLADGGHNFQVRAKDPAGNTDASPAVFTWTVNNFPDTFITISPPAISGSGSAAFYFTGTKAGSSFECSLDAAVFAPCSSPATWSGLQDGSHSFSVRAIDGAGKIDPTPAAFSWTIDTVAPDTIIDSGPADPANLLSATFTFRSTEAGGTFDCSLDGETFSACSSPKSYIGLASGPHTFQARAKDAAGNADPSPAVSSFNWSVDTSTLTVVTDVTKTYQPYNQVIYLTAAISSSAGQVNEGNVVFTVRNASSTVLGPITSPPVSGGIATTYTILPAGTPAGIYTMEARYSGGPTFKPGVGNGVLIVNPWPATITLSNLTRNYDGTPKQATVTTNPPGIAVSVTYDGSASPPINPGSYAVVASLADPNYAGPNAGGVLNIIGMAVPAISWNNPADIVYPTPLSSLQMNASADVPGAFTYAPSAGTVLDAGTSQSLRVDFAPVDTANYIATFKVVSINVLKGSQAINFGPLADKAFGAPDFNVTATSSSNLPVTFAASGSCTVSGNTVAITGAGSCTVTAYQAGDANYNPAPESAQFFDIAKATATISLAGLAQVYDGSPKPVTASTDPPGAGFVDMTYDGLPAAPAEAGSHTLVASLASSNYEAPDVTATLLILRAEAGQDQTAAENSGEVSIGSAASFGTVYEWIQLAGPPAALSDPAIPSPSIFVPSLEGGFGSQVVTFRLSVSGGGLSTSDTVNITVVNVNHSPVAETGGDQTVNEDAVVTLSGTHSYDPDGDTVSYRWVQTGGPAVAIADGDSESVSFMAPSVPGGIGGRAVLAFQLTVSDGELSDTENVVVTVEQVNHVPTADAGADMTVNEGSEVTLNGSGADPDGDSLAYRWTQTGGPAVVLTDIQSAYPSFTAPLTGPGGATLAFSLVTSDGAAESIPDTVTVAILNINDPPVCNLARANPELLWPPNHKLVEVGITGVNDSNNDSVKITVTGVMQDEPVNGLGDGDTGPDAVLQGDKALLRAERSGSGNGRVYRVDFVAEDNNGGSCTGSVRVTVPQNMGRGKTATDDGQSYVSTN
ncbi:MAG: right-handed parallel beta-helix repeat-containing protein [Deltaproteobacteria bacterium]|nr:right-handed parallel beta-helix repeat-containing protein [Deltaproteobacteria bacterium]